MNLECTGKKILVVGWGEARQTGALTNAVTANADGEVKYLETANSCNTLYGGEKQPTPEYAVYLGPFDSTREPCALRMSIDHPRDVVTNLKNGIKIHVNCLCAVTPRISPTSMSAWSPTPARASTSAPSNGCSSTSVPSTASRSPACTTRGRQRRSRSFRS